jgi:hypothetical protein
LWHKREISCLSRSLSKAERIAAVPVSHHTNP